MTNLPLTGWTLVHVSPAQDGNKRAVELVEGYTHNQQMKVAQLVSGSQIAQGKVLVMVGVAFKRSVDLYMVQEILQSSQLYQYFGTV